MKEQKELRVTRLSIKNILGNEARKVEIAIQIAGLRSGKLPLIIVDGLERLDSKTFEAFKKQAAKSKVQMIVTRVSDSALAVEA